MNELVSHNISMRFISLISFHENIFPGLLSNLFSFESNYLYHVSNDISSKGPKGISKSVGLLSTELQESSIIQQTFCLI